MDFEKQIAGHSLEYLDDIHVYLIDGVEVPSITQMLSVMFPDKYKFVNQRTLQEAAERGTEVHEAIEAYCKTGEDSTLKELRNFKFLMDKYGFEVLRNEVPVILFYAGEPVAAGRLDMVIRLGDEIGLADVKRTSVLDVNYLFYQLNLYRLAYQESYGKEISFLRGIHLREDRRKFVNIPINEDEALNFIKRFMEVQNDQSGNY